MASPIDSAPSKLTATPPPFSAKVGIQPVDILNSVQTVLKESKDFLSLAPVPGLPAAVGVLIAILDQVKKMKSNRETVEAIAREAGTLNDMLCQVKRRIEDRAAHLKMSPEQRTKMWVDLEASPGWNNRVEHLVKDLKALLEKAEPYADGPWPQRLLRSTRDEETLKTIRVDLAHMLQVYQLAGTLSIEALTEESLGRLEATYNEVKRVAAEQQAQREQQIINDIPHVDAAGYKSASNTGKSHYLIGTRDAVWRRIEEWESSDKPVCFLVGAAGMGKSTIAWEFCRRHEADIGASFFFRRNEAGVGSTALFFSTIAYQLAQSQPELRSHIARAADMHMKAGRSQQMKYTVEELLQKPFDEAKAAGLPRCCVYIVVDALDECDNSDSASQPSLVPECLRLLLTWALAHPSSLRLLITSRPDPDYVGTALKHGDFGSMLKDASVHLSLFNIEERQAVNHDIAEIIRAELCKVPEAAQWYQQDPTVVSQLTKQSQCVFVYACTAIVFITGSAGIAQMNHRLHLLLTSGNTYGLKHLDSLYRTVLETAFPLNDLDPNTRDQLGLILAYIALCQYSNGISPKEVEELSRIPCNEAIPIFTKLRSVLFFDAEAEDINKQFFRAMHVTFRDFLIDRERCGPNYYVDVGSMHARLATDCLKSMHNVSKGVEYKEWWSDHLVAAVPTKDLVNLLQEIFKSINTDRPSLFFDKHVGVQWHRIVLPADLLRWVDSHIGRDLAKTIGEQYRLYDPEVTIEYGEEITVSRLPRGSPGNPTNQEVEELKKQRRIQLQHLYKCWIQNYPEHRLVAKWREDLHELERRLAKK